MTLKASIDSGASSVAERGVSLLRFLERSMLSMRRNVSQGLGRISTTASSRG